MWLSDLHIFVIAKVFNEMTVLDLIGMAYSHLGKSIKYILLSV